MLSSSIQGLHRSELLKDIGPCVILTTDLDHPGNIQLRLTLSSPSASQIWS
jgi:hypothetical protein